MSYLHLGHCYETRIFTPDGFTIRQSKNLRGMRDYASRSSSGMSRVISLHIVDGSAVRSIDNLVADATDTRMAKNGGLIMGGCGMDMGFALVYDLGYALWPNGTDKPHGVRNGEPDTNGGYGDPSGEVIDKIRCDDYRQALDYYRSFTSLAKVSK